MRSTIFNLYLL